tara:strand:+ start:200 stop:1192 length:993 start_codon:yes stop_codon:yes gene_type:complete
MNKIFITGICGFVGSNLAHFFWKKKYQVFGADNLYRKGSHKNFLKLKEKGIKVFKGDLVDNKFLFKILKSKISFKSFIHCAAYTSVLDGTNKITAKELYENNILSTLNSLELSSHFKSNFIYLSSSRVYSIDALKKINPKIKSIKENFSIQPPLSIYGSSKIICENMIQEFCNMKKIPFIINRCGLLAGHGQLYKNDQGIISFWINSWKKNKKLSYIGFDGKGNQTRDCLHPNDLGNLIMLQIKKIKKLNSNNKVFNVSGGPASAFTLKELSKWCSNNIHFGTVKSAKKYRIFDLKWIVLNNEKAVNQFNWKLQFTKEKIFKDILKKNDQ